MLPKFSDVPSELQVPLLIVLGIVFGLLLLFSLLASKLSQKYPGLGRVLNLAEHFSVIRDQASPLRFILSVPLYSAIAFIAGGIGAAILSHDPLSGGVGTFEVFGFLLCSTAYFVLGVAAVHLHLAFVLIVAGVTRRPALWLRDSLVPPIRRDRTGRYSYSSPRPSWIGLKLWSFVNVLIAGFSYMIFSNNPEYLRQEPEFSGIVFFILLLFFVPQILSCRKLKKHRES